MKNIKNLFLIIFFNLSFAQKYIEIKYNYKTSEGNVCSSYLVLKGDKSVFKINDERENGIDNKLSTDNNVILVQNDKIGIFTYSNDSLNFNRIPLYKNEILYNTNNKNDFIFTNENKKIGNYNCNKATLKRNGRDFTIWFTKEIIYDKGPLNINGIPGLILEVYESYNNVSIEFVEMKEKDTSEIFDYVSNYFKNKKIYNFDEYSKNIINVMCAKKAKKIATITEMGGEISFPEKHNSFTNLLLDFPENLVAELKKIN